MGAIKGWLGDRASALLDTILGAVVLGALAGAGAAVLAFSGTQSRSQDLCEMVGAVDARVLGKRIGHLAHEELRAVDEALLLVLDLA